MVKHNNQLPNQHFRKDWQRRVKTWFNQPGAKKSRRLARAKKAALVAPRPVDGLVRPAVRCPTVKYNLKVRAGRGFSLEELKAAGIRKKEAVSMGISIDWRRKNRSEESLALNAERLKQYKTRLVVFPKGKKAKKGDADAAEVKVAKQLIKGQLLPIIAAATESVAADKQGKSAFATLRIAQADARLVGVKAQRAKAKAAEEAEKAK